MSGQMEEFDFFWAQTGSQSLSCQLCRQNRPLPVVQMKKWRELGEILQHKLFSFFREAGGKRAEPQISPALAFFVDVWIAGFSVVNLIWGGSRGGVEWRRTRKQNVIISFKT